MKIIREYPTPSVTVSRDLAPEYPKEFYCPITKQLLQDPVVAGNGRTYERSALKLDPNKTEFSSNHCLKTIISDHPHKSGANPDGNFPHEYICPISLDVMTDPVVTRDGFSYERTAIAKHFKNRANSNTVAHSPRTGLPLSDMRFMPNHALRTLINNNNEARKARPPTCSIL